MSSTYFTNRTILITGASSGIGLALAERLVSNNTVIIVGRRTELLAQIKDRIPALHTHTADVSSAEQRVALFQWATSTYPNLDVLINNAGIQRAFSLRDGSESIEAWQQTASEVEINLLAPIHLTQLFVAHLEKQPSAALVNVTSGLSFVAIAAVPVYCATKAALHSFTLSTRHQLRDTNIRVVEIVPPAVNTDLGGPGKHTMGVDLNEYADATVQALHNDQLEITFGFSSVISQASRAQVDEMFAKLNTNVVSALKSATTTSSSSSSS